MTNSIRKVHRTNPYAIERIQMIIDRKTLDGDQSLCNEFASRARVTIGDMEKAYERWETIGADVDAWEIVDLVDEIKVRYGESSAEVQEKVKASILEWLA